MLNLSHKKLDLYNISLGIEKYMESIFSMLSKMTGNLEIKTPLTNSN